MADLARLAVHLASFPTELDLGDLIPLARRFDLAGIGLLRAHLERYGLRDASRLVRDHGLEVTSLSYGGFFTAPDGAERRARIDDTRRAIDQAAALEARCLLVAAGGLPPGSRDLEGARHMVEDALAIVVDHAASAGVWLALEPHHPMYAADRSVLTTLEEALAICEAFGRDAPIGIGFDTFHGWWQPRLDELLQRLGPERLRLVQIADWPRGLTDPRYGRTVPGEGVVDFPLLRRRLTGLGYDGPFELEVPGGEVAGRDPAGWLRRLVEGWALRA